MVARDWHFWIAFRGTLSFRLHMLHLALWCEPSFACVVAGYPGKFSANLGPQRLPSSSCGESGVVAVRRFFVSMRPMTQTEGNQKVTGEVRVRFAPSPTGTLHIGGARTAYFNWLFARQNGGSIILRIDDTDQARSTEASYQQILQSFAWLGLDFDESPEVGGDYGPYRQSQRLHIYREQLSRLVEEEKVYPCFCSAEELTAEREAAKSRGQAARYSGKCRNLSPAEAKARIEAGDKPVYRLRAPQTGSTVVSDLIRGEVTFDNGELDDFIVWKADGMPTYHFASCVDDVAMKMTHIIRADEHLSNTPRHIHLFLALGAELPVFAHVPMILAPDRSKLSKRHGATSVEEYREAGILSDALVNYLLLLGFSPEDNRELVSRKEAVEMFHLERVAKHAAVYDVKKLEWLNATYFRAVPAHTLVHRLLEKLRDTGDFPDDPSAQDLAWLRTAIVFAQDRSRNEAELQENLRFYFRAPESYDEKGLRKHFLKPGVEQRLRWLAEKLSLVRPFDAASVEMHYAQYAAHLGLKTADLIHPTRLALTGVTGGPGLYDIMALLGRRNCLERLLLAADYIGAHWPEDKIASSTD
jgi:glutamyl-tRNA synthetase